MANEGLTSDDSRVIFLEPEDVTVLTPHGEQHFLADRWEFIDTPDLSLYLDDICIQSFPKGEWTGCYAFGARREKGA